MYNDSFSHNDDVLWKPSDQSVADSNLTAFSLWLNENYGLSFTDYNDLWQWSIDNTEIFWSAIWDYYAIIHEGNKETNVITGSMPDVKWFQDTYLNYAEHLLRNPSERPAIYFKNEKDAVLTWTWEELTRQAAAFQDYLSENGVRAGDTCVAYLPNIPQALACFIACAASGVIWSSCSPDFGTSSVIDRFSQIEPKVLITCDGYSYNGKKYDRTEESRKIASQLPSLRNHLHFSYLHGEMEEWAALMDKYENAVLKYVKLPFAHPLWVLYSSGTTGIPKAITHSHGGCLLEHLKYIHLHNEVKPEQLFFWYSTTGWMMWNYANASLLAGASLFIYDGSPAYPDINILWELADRYKIHHFGTSAPYLVACMKKNVDVRNLNLNQLISIGSTGAPLPPEAFDYVYGHIHNNVWLCSMAGGTDVCTAFVGSNIWSPVKRGKIQGRALGVSLHAYDENGKPLREELGEMVIEKALPSMPIYFWNDKNKERYLKSYFNEYPGKWRHGDWIEIDRDGQLVIHGRSDATLNRHGIRIGTSEIYRSINKISEIEDSLIVNLELKGGKHYMPLFVKMRDNHPLSDEVISKVANQLKSDYSPRHVPDRVIQVYDIPYTLSGKKLESPVKKILLGMELSKAANKESTKNPAALEYFMENREKILAKV